MKRYGHIVLYVFALIITYLSLNYALFRIYESGIWHPFNSKAIIEGSGGSGHSLQRYRDWKETEQATIVFAGSSHTYRSINCNLKTLEFGPGFNWGSTSQTPLNTYYLLQSLDLSNKQTRVVILDLFYRLMSDNNGTEACFDINTNLPLSANFLRMNLASEDLLSINHLMAIACDRLGRPYDHLVQQNIRCDAYIGKGYVQHCDSGSANHNLIISEAQKGKKQKLSERQIQYLEKCTKWLRSQGIYVVWISQPLPELLRKHDPSYQVIQSSLHELAENLKVDFWDLSADNGAWKFFDWHHLNAASADRYTEFIFAKLQNTFKDDIEWRKTSHH